MNVDLLRLLSKQVKLSKDALEDYTYMDKKNFTPVQLLELRTAAGSLRDAVRRIDEVLDTRLDDAPVPAPNKQ